MNTNRYKLPIASLILIACALVLLASSIALSANERRTALVIGNGAYKSSPLANPVNDANDMAAALEKLGFSVRLKINANQKSMENAIRDFGKELRSGGVGLFYFAGHGLQVYGRNYLIPIDAEIESEADVKYESLDAGRVLSQMYEAQNGLNIIILDACRDNPYARSFRSSEKGLAKMDAPTGSILAYATAPGSVAADGTGRNGLYTSMLLKHMMEPNLILERVFKNVRIDVMKESANRQVPWESSSLTGDFYFTAKRGIVVKKQPEVESKKPIIESLKHASISPEISSAERSDSRYKLAIFPWKLENFKTYGTSELSIKEGAKNALRKTLMDNQKFFPLFSYYDLQNINTRKIDENILTKEVLDELWIKKSFYSEPKPNINLICKIGKQLKLDAVLTYHLLLNQLSDENDVINVFLINVKTKKIYNAKDYHHGFMFEPTLAFQFVTNKVYAEFEKDASQ